MKPNFKIPGHYESNEDDESTIVLAPKTIKTKKINALEAGYGRCRSCDCKGYISKHNGSHECKNCNHHFDRHQ